MAQPDVLPASDQGFGEIGNEVEEEEPVGPGRLGTHVSRDQAGRDVVHHHETVDDLRMVLGKTRRDTGAAVVTDRGECLDSERTGEFDDVARHVALVVARCRLVRLAVAAQVWRDHPEAGRKHGDLVAPGKGRLREAVQQNDARAFAGIEIMLANAIRPDGPMLDGHQQSSSPAGRAKTGFSPYAAPVLPASGGVCAVA